MKTILAFATFILTVGTGMLFPANARPNGPFILSSVTPSQEWLCQTPVACTTLNWLLIGPRTVKATKLPSVSARQSQLNVGVGLEAAIHNVTDSSRGRVGIDNVNNIRYVTTADDWRQKPAETLIAGVEATITLSPCPNGIDGRDDYGVVYITDIRPVLSEPVQLTGRGTCRSKAASGTITLTSRTSHVSGYTIGSASSGIYETLAAQRNNLKVGEPGYGSNGNGYIITGPASGGNAGGVAYTYKVKGTIRVPLNNVFWDAKGSVLECATRDACIEIGKFGPLFLDGIRMTSDLDITGWPIVSTECDINNSSGFDPSHNGVTTITTTVAHAIQVGDLVDVVRTDNSHYWGGSLSTNAGVTRVAGVRTQKVYYPDHNCNNGGVGYPTANTPGYINILNAPILDSSGARITDLDLDKPGSGRMLFGGHFNQGLTVLNDQAAIIDGIIAGALTSGDRSTCTTVNPYCGSIIYAPGPFLNAAVLWIKHANLGLNCAANGIWALSGNTVHVSDSVVQGQPQFGMVLGNRRGGFGNVTLTNVYSEAGRCTNPDFGIASTMGAYIYGQGEWTGGEGPQGTVPEFATGGSISYYYWLVVTDPTRGNSAPLYFGHGTPSGSAQNIVWPRVPSGVKGTPTYTIVRSTNTNNSPTPTSENCPGGSMSACGVVAAGLAQCEGLSCTYTDDVSAVTMNAAAVLPANPTYVPDLMFWPGGLVMGGGGNFEFENHDLLAGGISLAGDATPWASTLTLGSKNPSGYVQALGGNVTLLDEKNSNRLFNTKGRIILERPHGATVYQGHFITLVDSDPLANLSSSSKRSILNASDTYIGNDVPGAPLNGAGLALGSPTSITQYINAGPDGSSWQERLTVTKKEVKVPTVFDAPVSALVTCNGCSPFSLPPPQLDDFNRTTSGTMTISSKRAGAAWIAAWNNATSYVAGNVVTLGGMSFIAIATNTNEPPPNQRYWLDIALGPRWSTLLGAWGILPGPFTTASGRGRFPTNYASFTSLTTESGIGRAYAYYSGASFGADQYIQATISPANSVIGICVRMTATTPLSAYCAVTGSGQLALSRFVKGIGFEIYTGAETTSLSAVKLMVQGSTLTLFVNGIVQVTINDSVLTTGYPGLYGQNLVTPDNLIDNVYVGSATWTGIVGAATGVYEAGVLSGKVKTYTNKESLIAGTATHTFANGFGFSSSSTFGCTCTDQTAPNACQVVPTSATAVSLAGTGIDVLWLSCTGH